MRKSKYLNRQFGLWTCTHVGVARVQQKRLMHSKGPAKRPGHQSYYYVFERRTSDNKADKMIRLGANEASRVYKGLITVEEILEAREAKPSRVFTEKISYSFN